MAKISLIGIGNPYRGDDGAGWAVIDAIQGKLGSNIAVSKLRGDIADLLEHFKTHRTVYLVDACEGDAPVGTWQRIDALQDPLQLERTQTSTHGLSLTQAISLGHALNQLPAKLIIYAICANRYSMSDAISAPVAKAVETVVQSLLNEKDIRACMKKA